MPEPITQTLLKIYLGDGAYADWDEGLQQVKITTENGLEVTNAVYVEPSGMHDLFRWWGRLIEKTRLDFDA